MTRPPAPPRGAWLTGFAAVLLSLGLLAGTINHEVLDGPRFAQHVDEVRQDPAVSAQVGAAITARILTAEPDLVALRPLVQAAVVAVVGSDAFSPVVTFTARGVYRTLSGDSSGPVEVRLTDLGAVLAGVLSTVDRESAKRLPPDLAVTLAQVDQSSAVARAIRLVHFVTLLAWLLPLLAAGLLLAGCWRARDRPAAAVRAGRAIAAAGGGLGLIALAGALAAARADTDSLRGALLAAGWRTVSGGLWWTSAGTVLAGATIALVAAGRRPRPAAALHRVWVWARVRPVGRAALVGRGAALTGAGAVTLLSPTLALQVGAVGVGVVLALLGIEEAAMALPRPTPRPDPQARSRERGRGARGGRAVVGVAGVALLVAVVALGASPSTRTIDTTTTASEGSGCNGHVELCSRRFNDVAFAAAHNAMSAADEPGWFLAEQPTGLTGQLDLGVRALLIDTWYGQPTTRPGFTVTAPQSYDAALAASQNDYDPAVVASALRLRAALTPATTGPPVPFLCHGLCETGSTPLKPALTGIGGWLAAHPREVVTLFIEDNVTPADTASAFDQAGLLPYLYTPAPGQPSPTLGEMIDSGHRLVVLTERQGGGTTYPWLQQGFDVVQDTPYTNPTPADLTCALNRGSAGNPLFLINNWLSGFTSLVSDARTVNAAAVLQPYVDRCRTDRHQIPNFVAVNYVDQGDLFGVVDQLNGVK